ncbi:MAG: hydantoinase B/oxoprolinase family protein [Pseudomonadales bacterium]|nr:hydantoinase B/oxoprolinase family protein [Pseudomonadales bacterium]
MSELDGIKLSLFSNRVQAICDEMGVMLKSAAFSPNIKDRLDFSCALFDAQGQLFGQAAHIPVHLGSMAYAMRSLTEQFDWQVGDLVMLNDPFLGGTHLPDITIVTPVFFDNHLMAFVASRAHHANIGSDSPGSMPLSTVLEEEGLVIPPTLMFTAGKPTNALLSLFEALSGQQYSNIDACRSNQNLGDYFAQFGANKLGQERLEQLIASEGHQQILANLDALNDYAERITRGVLFDIPDGTYKFSDCMDDDGTGAENIVIRVLVQVRGDAVSVDFTNTDDQVRGNINCPKAVTAAAVYYVFRCLMPEYMPAAQGGFRAIQLITRSGSLVDAVYPAAVAAGNVETSSRIVDVLLGALALAIPDLIPAASQGTMNNVAMGKKPGQRAGWDYYETIGGGSGAYALGDGLSGKHSHMTNTLNTPVESLEAHYPLQIVRYELNPGSGGNGLHKGGDGLVREFRFLERTEVSLLTERRTLQPWGLSGGQPAKPGLNTLNGEPLAAKTQFQALPGDQLCIATPGGGGWGHG